MKENLKIVKSGGQTAAIETVTPEDAEKWLAHRESNRSIGKKMVERYANEIREGNWLVTGDAIRFAKNGKLIDGQHRLAAIIEANTPIETWVIRGLDIETMAVMDSGKKRMPAHELTRLGYKNTHMLAAAARWLLTIKYGYADSGTRSFHPTTIEIKKLVKKHPGLEESTAAGSGPGMRRPQGIMPSLLCAIHYIGTHMLDKEEEADAFFNTFCTRLPNPELYPEPDTDPALKWVERLMRRKTGQLRLTDNAVCNGTIYIWNLYADHRKMSRGIIIPRTQQTIDGLDVDKI